MIDIISIRQKTKEQRKNIDRRKVSKLRKRINQYIQSAANSGKSSCVIDLADTEFHIYETIIVSELISDGYLPTIGNWQIRISW